MTAKRGSQDGEDVVLDTILPRRVGTYIDIGAWHPFHLSNTIGLYDRGWRGLLVEPQADMALALARHRPGDWVLPMAVSNRTGAATLRMAGACSTLEENWPIQDGVTILVETHTASQIIEWFPQLQVQCDFCSIDVEGHEQAVLEGWNWLACRPAVLLIESVMYHPRGKGRPTWQKWEPILIANGYEWVTQVGVNRIYRLV